MTFFLIYENGKPIGNPQLYEVAFKNMMKLKEQNPHREYKIVPRYF